jgi:hypothetical protein
MTKIAGSGSISQRHGSADPDPHQNVMDPQHRYGMVWYGLVWYGMAWYGMVWYGMVLCMVMYLFAELEGGSCVGWRSGWTARPPCGWSRPRL